jgi:uncharacterized protein YodC (DUF2158 family)
LICFILDVGSSCHAVVQFINVNLVEATNRFSHFQSIATSAFALLGHASVGQGPVRTAPSIPKENVMRRRVMVVLAGAALVGSLLATDAQARGGGGGGVGHIGGARVGGFGGARVGGIGGRYMAGISRGAVGYAPGTGNGTGIGNRTGIRYGTGILRDRFSIFAASAFAQNATANGSAGAGSTGAYGPAPASSGAVPNPPVGGPSQETISGPGFTIVGRNGVSTKTVGMAPASSSPAPSNTQNQAARAFRSGNLVRLRSGGPLMTVKGIKGDQVDCFWTDVTGQINADSFPVDVLQMG